MCKVQNHWLKILTTRCTVFVLGFVFFVFPFPYAVAQMRDQAKAQLMDLAHVRDLQKAAEGRLQKCQESLLSCQKSCVDKSKVIRELQVQVRGDSSFWITGLNHVQFHEGR